MGASVASETENTFVPEIGATCVTEDSGNRFSSLRAANNFTSDVCMVGKMKESSLAREVDDSNDCFDLRISLLVMEESGTTPMVVYGILNF